MDNITTREELDQILKDETKIVLVDFWAEWCGPCKALGPTLTEIASERKDDVRIVKVNVDQSAGLAQHYGIRGIPTLIFFKDGQVKKTEVGNRSKSELLAKIKEIN